jgi:hypothetical protein
MISDSDIINSIQQIANSGKDVLPAVIFGSVVSVDSATSCTIQPNDSNLNPISNILLTADSNGSPIFVPAIGTIVCVSMISNSSGIITQHGAVSSAALGGNQHGAIAISSDIVNRLNLIENIINTFFTLYNGHTHTVAAAPGTTAVPIQLEDKTLTITNINDLTDPNAPVTHGTGTPNTPSVTAEALLAQYNTAEDLLEQFQAQVADLTLEMSKNNQAKGIIKGIINFSINNSLNDKINALTLQINSQQLVVDTLAAKYRKAGGLSAL